MLYTVRLTPAEGRLLSKTAKATSKKRAELVREAISAYCADTLGRLRRSALDAIAGRVGCARSGRNDLGTRSRELFRKALHERRTGAR